MSAFKEVGIEAGQATIPHVLCIVEKNADFCASGSSRSLAANALSHPNSRYRSNFSNDGQFATDDSPADDNSLDPAQLSQLPSIYYAQPLRTDDPSILGQQAQSQHQLDHLLETAAFISGQFVTDVDQRPDQNQFVLLPPEQRVSQRETECPNDSQLPTASSHLQLKSLLETDDNDRPLQAR